MIKKRERSFENMKNMFTVFLATSKGVFFLAGKKNYSIWCAVNLNK